MYALAAVSMPLDQQIDLLLAVISWLIVAVLLLAMYISQAPPYEWKGWNWYRPSEKAEPVCPLHKIPRSQCSEESHRDE